MRGSDRLVDADAAVPYLQQLARISGRTRQPTSTPPSSV
jgi:hypothetical protein